MAPCTPSANVPVSVPIARDVPSKGTELASHEHADDDDDNDPRFYVGLNVIHPQLGTGTIVRVVLSPSLCCMADGHDLHAIAPWPKMSYGLVPDGLGWLRWREGGGWPPT